MARSAGCNWPQLEREARKRCQRPWTRMQRARDAQPRTTRSRSRCWARISPRPDARARPPICSQPRRESRTPIWTCCRRRALALARLGRFDEALAPLTRARERDPRTRCCWCTSGQCSSPAVNEPRPARRSTRSVRLESGVARAHSSLGVLALEDGRAGPGNRALACGDLARPTRARQGPRAGHRVRAGRPHGGSTGVFRVLCRERSPVAIRDASSAVCAPG